MQSNLTRDQQLLQISLICLGYMHEDSTAEECMEAIINILKVE